MYERPGHRHYAQATTTHTHNQPVVYEGVPGVAHKQKTPSSGAAAGTVQKQIASGENFAIICKGRVQFTNAGTGSPFARGAKLYITSTHAITTSNTGNTPFGLVVETSADSTTSTPGPRGTPTGQMRVDLDLKNTF